MIVRVRVVVSGLVQGVFFRASAADQARRTGVAGYVRNLPDGSVEAAFEGPQDAVESMVAWCHGGPEWARVDRVHTFPEEPAGEAGFSIR